MNALARCLPIAVLATGVPAFADEQGAGADDGAYPLEVHMRHWLRGSGEWRTPNPDADSCAGSDARCLLEFGVNWQWDEAHKIMRGELTGIYDDGSAIRFWSMFAFYNPVTEDVLFQQIGRGGTFITGSQEARPWPLRYGETERLDTVLYAADGTTKETRHENVFAEDGSHVSRVFEKDETGEWVQVNEWLWRLTSSE